MENCLEIPMLSAPARQVNESALTAMLRERRACAARSRMFPAKVVGAPGVSRDLPGQARTGKAAA
jgi:hypothetical protein